MIHLICDICGKDYQRTPDIFYQVFIQEVTDGHIPNKSICLCRGCMPKHLLRAAIPMADLSAIRSEEITTTDEDAVSQTLREFLDSEYYMSAAHSFNFYTTDHIPILELTSYMDWRIIRIYPENEDGSRNITLKQS